MATEEQRKAFDVFLAMYKEELNQLIDSKLFMIYITYMT